MIEYRDFKAPHESTAEVIALLKAEFGESEESLERRQLGGAEAGYNDDYVFTAREDGRLLGCIHLTVTAKNSFFGCLGGLVTVPEARGRGIAKELFGKACGFFDGLGGGLLLLGTGNPVAARMYGKFGFGFLRGTGIMARVKDGSVYDALRGIYSGGEYGIAGMDDGCRVPIVLAAADPGRDVLMDANAGIINCGYATQFSCTGLYPRFLRIKENGSVLAAKLKNGGVCAVLSEKIENGAHNVDCFAKSGFEHILPELLETALKRGTPYSAVVFRGDAEKLALFEKFGFSVKRGCDYEFNSLRLSCLRLEK